MAGIQVEGVHKRFGDFEALKSIDLEIKDQELAKALERLAKGDSAETVLKSLANQLTNKIIHNPSVQLKQASAEGRDDVIDALVELFQLDDNNEGS